MAAQADSGPTEQCKNEFSVLEAIYGNELCFEGQYRLKIPIQIGSEAFEPLCLLISVGETYPATVPTYSFAPLPHGKWLTSDREKKLISSLKGLFDAEDEGNIMRAIEWIRENAYTEMDLSESDLVTHNQPKEKTNTRGQGKSAFSAPDFPVPTIYHSHRITDRKSKFQAHFSRCWSEVEVQAVIDSVREDPKCSQAVHPCIYAWRLESTVPGEVVVGSSDDGEGGAAAFLENLLQTRNILNGVLMVTRWFGGTLLGPDRFRHISNISELLLNSIFIQTFTEKDVSSPKATFATTQSFEVLISASTTMKNQKDAGLEYHLTFITPHTLQKTGPIKLSSFASNRANYPLCRLTTIQSTDGSELWSNYSPGHVNVAQI